MLQLLLMVQVFGCASENYARLYHTETKAPSLTWEALEKYGSYGSNHYGAWGQFCSVL